MENLNTKIGLVGLGIIGSSILKNIHSAGQKSSGFDIDENSMIRLSSEGFETTKSIDLLFESSNILITSLPSSKALDETIDALINNVGIAGPTGVMEDLSIDDWKQTIDINLNSHFYFTKFAIPLLKKNQGGSIINLSSTAGLFGFPLRTPYAASKWAIIGVTKSLAMELGKFNIRVNAICPGSVSGDRIDRVIAAKASSLGINEKELREDFEGMVSLKTFVDKEDIANMATFLVSEEAKRVSGQIMTVDGHTERMD